MNACQLLQNRMANRNKHGQALGLKGEQSRQRIVNAARVQIAKAPATRITASEVAREAGLASQTFYLYFKDIDEVLLMLSEEAAADLGDVYQSLAKEWEPHSPAEQSKRFIDSLMAYWDRNRPVLNMRNFLADAGHPDFLRSRERAAMPIVNLMTDRIMDAHASDQLDRRKAFARSVIIFSAIERLASRPATMTHHGTSVESEMIAQDLRAAEQDILTLLFSPA